MATLTCAALTAIYYSAESVFADGMKKADYISEVNAAKAIIENTTATIKLIDNAGKPRTARVYWSKKAAATITDCAEDPIDLCDLSGEEADAGCSDYTVEGCLSASFTVDEKKYEGSNLNFNDVLADNLLLTMKDLDEAVTQAIIAKVDSYSSKNLHHGAPGCASVYPSSVAANWAVTNIDPAYWTPEIMAYFLTVARINKFNSPFLLDGDNLYNQIFKAQNNAGNADGSGAKNMMDKMKYYEDMVNMAIVNPSARKTFMINRGSLAFSSYALWEKVKMTAPKEHGAGQWKFSIPSKNIPGLVYDVYTKTECSDEYEKHTFTLKATFDVFNGPTDRNLSTGVLEFQCAACPTS